MAEEALILIGGGVGPMAGVGLHQLILENTATDGSDQSHLSILHVSCSSEIPDRTEFLLHGGADPAAAMVRVFARSWTAARAFGRDCVAGIPCVTFHAPSIFGPFLAGLEAAGVGVRVLSLLDETAAYLADRHPGVRAVGLLTTTGARKVGVCRGLLERLSLKVVEVPEGDQENLQDAIYDRTWGLKAVSPASAAARVRLEAAVASLIDGGAEAVVLGCSELPLALGPSGPIVFPVPLINPVLALARALVREAAPAKLAAI